MPEIWMSQAIKADLGDHAPCDPALPPKAIAHITADRNATAEAPQDLVSFAHLQNFFTNSGAGLAPHILWDPFTGAFAQFFPATSRSKALADAPGGTRTNRAGEVVLQIEALFFPHCRADGRVCAALTDTPCKGWSELNAWIRSWGVPDTWPMGRPTNFVSARSPDVWSSRGGWYAHAHVPENNHVDPGSWPAFVQEQPRKPGGGPVDRLEFEPFPGPSFFQAGRRSPIIAAMHRRLVAEDCDRYRSSSNIAVWGAGDARSYTAWQKKLGHSGSAANGIPGKASWDRLRVPNI